MVRAEQDAEVISVEYLSEILLHRLQLDIVRYYFTYVHGRVEREAFDKIRRRGVVIVACFPSGDHVSPVFRESRTAADDESNRSQNDLDRRDDGENVDAKPAEAPMPPAVVRASHPLPAKIP